MEAFMTLINQAERIVVLTGAGMSTESGIPDFRSAGGISNRRHLQNGSDEQGIL